MNPWSYKKYLNSAQNDILTGINDMGFSPLQAFGFAHNELSARLEEFPKEAILALTALATCLSEYNDLDNLEEDSEFLVELKSFINGKSIDEINFELEDQRLFLSDLERIKSVFGW